MFKAKEIAQRLNCSLGTVYSLWASGALPFVLVGTKKGKRSTEMQLEDFISRRTAQTKEPPKRTAHVKLKHLNL